MRLYAVASILTLLQPDAGKIAWHQIERLRAAHGIVQKGVLHFSWHVAEHYSIESCREIMGSICTRLEPRTLTGTGLGLFTGETPVLYMPVIKVRWVDILHQELWKNLTPHSSGLVSHYSPENWIPHISIASKGAQPEQVTQLASEILMQKLEIEFRVDNLAIIYRDDKEHGTLFTVPFGAGV